MSSDNTVVNDGIENINQSKELIKIKKDKDLLKKVKYESVDRKVGIQSLYYSILATLGYTLLLEKPKKQKTKTLPIIQLYQLYDQNGSCVFDRDFVFEKAKTMKIGVNKPNEKRTIRQFVSNETVNSMIKIIEENDLVSIKEGRSKRNVVNEDVPQQRKIQSLELNFDHSHKIIDLNKQALTNGKIYHEALLKIFDNVQSDGIIVNGNSYNIGFLLKQPLLNIIDHITKYFHDHCSSSLTNTTFVPIITDEN